MKTLLLIALAWLGLGGPVTYNISKKTDPVTQVALDMMKGDLEAVMDAVPVPAGTSSASIRIIQYDKDKAGLAKLGVPKAVADSLGFVKEAFYLGLNGNQLVVVGSDAHGTAYGILEVSRLAGVSPWVWWGDSAPEKKSSIEIPDGYSTFQHPSVEYRGIFLNDEDWAFRPWSTKTFSPVSDGTISADTYRQIFKLLLRLRGNTMWPGMHNYTTPFFMVPGARETADSCGIYIGTSHCEPFLRNNVGEWDVAERGRYNYMTNRDAVLEYWKERLVEMKGRGGLYTVGMRGIHDGSMEGLEGATLDEKTAALQNVIDDQRELISKYSGMDVTKVPQTFMPYKEVLEIYENGLRLPDDVTIVWCDDNYGYMTRLSDAGQQKRSGGAGVYYHLSYAGRPHDVLWLTTAQPGLIYNEMMEAYNHDVRKLWIANVNDPKKAGYDLEFFLDLAWDVDAFRPETLNDHLENWLVREYGEAGHKLLAPMAEFYRLCSIRKPEYMGWSQTELSDREHYPTTNSPAKDTEFSFTEFGDEATRYIESYRALRSTVEQLESSIPERSRDSYFAYIKYPVSAASSMAEKMLFAQKARSRATQSYSPGEWNVDSVMMASAARSQAAYQDIRRLTKYYNEQLAGGKWNRNMSMNPRNLYAFWAPDLPVALTDSEVDEWLGYDILKPSSPVSPDGADYHAANACDYSRASFSPHPVQSLGHSGYAVPVPKGESLSYEFETSASGKAVVRVAVLPTQANDKGDIRFSVSVDGGAPQVCSIKEPYRSERWKENVIRNQARVEIPVELSAGKHVLTFAAVDDHIVLDQWMVDFKPARSFYVFPVSSAPVKLFIAGDSTAQTYDPEQTLMRGWAQELQQFFDSRLQVVNHSIGGRSTGSFIRENRWQSVLDGVRPGDWVMIQFGHNDTSTNPQRHVEPEQYKANLMNMCADVRARGGNPVILTSIVMRTYRDGKLVDERPHFAEYIQLARDAAAEAGVPLVDMNALTTAKVLSLGDEGSAELYYHVKVGDHPKLTADKTDDTHLREKGAVTYAGLLAEDIARQNLSLAGYLR